MIKAQLDMDHRGKRVMDAGCGTAILSVMASKRGAKNIESFDIDDWSIENGQENAERNQCPNIHIRKGTIRDFSWPDKFDIILANINKNVLMDELDLYSMNLKEDGLLLLSGFYEQDIPDLTRQAAGAGLAPQRQDVREGWSSLLLKKR
jgi:ribosomal protein L11 methyltransferase